MVLCGAGISFDSGIPLVKMLIEAILRALRFNKANIQQVLAKVPDAIPFERFIETVISSSPSRSFLSLFQLGQPNSNHHALASLAAAGCLHTIVTTNFDLLIERALESQSELERGTDFVVHDNPKDFAVISPNDSRVQVIKLHGSAELLDSMAVTLSGIMKDENRQMVSMLARRLMSEWPVGGVLVAGYSCSDKFDISPGIASAKREKQTILQLEHMVSPSDGVRPGDINPVEVPPWGRHNKDYPFSGFSGYRLFSDTSIVLRRISAQISGSKTSITGSIAKPRWRAVINKWADELRKMYPRIACPFVSGAIFQLVEAWSDAHRSYERALRIAQHENHPGWTTACQNALGNIHLSRGELNEAGGMFARALKISRESKNHFGVQQCLLNLSNLYRQWGDLLHTKAIAFSSEALNVIDEHSKESWPLGTRATHHSAMAMLYGRQWEFVEAFRNFKAARQEFREAGELQRELAVVSNWASALFATQRFEESLTLYDEAIALARACGDSIAVGQMTINRGNALARLGRLQESLEVYHLAEEIIIPIVGVEHELLTQIKNFRRQVSAMLQDI